MTYEVRQRSGRAFVYKREGGRRVLLASLPADATVSGRRIGDLQDAEILRLLGLEGAMQPQEIKRKMDEAAEALADLPLAVATGWVIYLLEALDATWRDERVQELLEGLVEAIEGRLQYGLW